MKKFILIIMFLSLGSLSQNEELLAKDLKENKSIIEKSEDSEAEYIWENFMYEMDR